MGTDNKLHHYTADDRSYCICDLSGDSSFSLFLISQTCNNYITLDTFQNYSAWQMFKAQQKLYYPHVMLMDVAVVLSLALNVSGNF